MWQIAHGGIVTEKSIERPLAELAAARVLARVTSATALPGVIRKQLIVPEGQVGLIVTPNGGAQVLAAGVQSVGSVGGWFNGRFPQTNVVLLPAQPITLVLTSAQLAGDGVLVDVTGEVVAHINPQPFYAHLLAHNGQVTWLEVEAWLSQAVNRPLATAVADYAAADLAAPVVRQAIAGQLKQGLQTVAPAVGLSVQAVRGLSINPAADTLARAEQHEALQAELRRLEQDEAMDRLTQAAELRAFAQQLEADFGVTGLTDLVIAEAESRAVADGKGGEGDTAVAPLSRISQLSRRLAESRLAAELGQRWQRLQGGEPDRSIRPEPAEPAWLRWLTPVRYVFSAIALGLVVFSFWRLDANSTTYQVKQIEILFSAAGLMIGILSTLWAEARARQRLLNEQISGSLARLSRYDQAQADRFMRRQVVGELAALRDKLKDARFKLHRAGDKTAVLQLKEMEQHVERLEQELGRANVAPAAYVTDGRLTAAEVGAMLHYDESLLLQLNHIGDSAQTLLAATVMNGDVAAAIPSLAAELTEFEHRFRARARFIRTPLANS